MRPHGSWLQSPRWDGFWLLSNYWLILLVGVFEAVPNGLKALFITSVVLLLFSHRVATTYTAFCMPAYRKLIREQGRRFLLWPAIAILASFGFFFTAEAVFGLDLQTRFLIIAVLVVVGQTIHEGMQHYGVVTIYRVRAGQSPFSPFKRYEKVFCLAIATLVVSGPLLQGAAILQYSRIYGILSQVVPLDLLAEMAGLMSIVAPTLAGVLTVILFIGEWRDPHRSLPKTLYAGSLFLQACLAYYMHPLGFLVVWKSQHYLVSLALAGRMADNTRADPGSVSGWYRFWGRFNRGFWPTVAVLCVVSLVSAPFLTYGVLTVRLPVDLSSIMSILQVPAVGNFLSAVILSTFLVHLLLDRAVFRLSDPRIREVTGSLIFGGSVRGT